MPIELDLTRDLAKVRGNTGPLGRCRYTAPCAIGAMMSADDRDDILRQGTLVDATRIRSLLSAGKVVAPAEQHADLIALQFAFYKADFFPEDFERTLTELEAKYNVVHAA